MRNNPAAQPTTKATDASNTVLSFGYLRALLQMRNHILSGAGFHVLTATSMRQAFEFSDEYSPDAVVFGHRVPPHERNTLVRHLKTINSSIAVVMLYRGIIEEADMADAILNADGDPEDLVQTIRYLLTRPGPPQA